MKIFRNRCCLPEIMHLKCKISAGLVGLSEISLRKIEIKGHITRDLRCWKSL